MKPYAKHLLINVLSLTLVATLYSQSLPDPTSKKIDSLYAKWSTGATPGCAVGIVRNDTLVYSKGFGMANLEYGIPNTPATIFHMASISKQFTAWSIMLLARQGKLRLDDDVRRYLPWLPDLKEKITIRHLLNHTSGIRDQWQLLAIAGTRLDDVITQEHIVKLLSKQQALNFKPGEKYSYSNSGYTMLAEIVRAVSGLSLRKFTDSAIFRPLGMSNTHFHDDYTEIEKNRAYSYDRLDSNRFANSVLSYSNAGATSLFTNINDMSKWVMNFYQQRKDDQQIIDSLTKKGKLNDGKELSYASGIVVGTHKGWKQYSHGGADAGYRTYISVFPDLKMGVLVFSNVGDFNTGELGDKMAELFITDTTRKKEKVAPKKKDSTMAILKDSMSYKSFLGSYIGEEGLPFSFDIRNGKLYYHIYGESNILVKESKNNFAIMDNPSIKFAFSVQSKDTIVDIKTPDELYHLGKYVKDTTQSSQLLQTYAGTYYCAELDCRYSIVLKDGSLMLTNAKYNDTKVVWINNDHLTTDHWWMSHLKVLRDGNSQVIGFEVNSGRIMHLKFIKIAQ